MINFAERLKELRKEKEITQKQLADALNVTQTAINYWERGKREPDFKTIQEIAIFFKVTPSYLIGWTEKKMYTEESMKASAEITGTQKQIETTVIIGDLLDELNEIGQDKAIEQVELLTKIPEYRKEPEPDTPE